MKLWYIYTMEYYSVIKRTKFELVEMRWINLEPVVKGEVRKRKTKQMSYVNAQVWNLEKCY